MSNNLLQVINTQSLQKLRLAVLANPDIVDLKFDDLVDKLSLNLVASTYEFDDSIRLQLPTGFSQSENNDSINCALMLKALPSLSPANATDDRLWVTLSFGHFSEYVHKRWPFRISEENKLTNHVINHWFAKGPRGRMRDNGVSRLWWMGYIASKVPDMEMNSVFDLLFANSDYRSSLLERTGSSNALSVLVAVLKISNEFFIKGIPYEREKFRDFMREVNFLGGRRNLAAMSHTDLIDLFRPLYSQAYKI
jgi:hypothetical protein